MLRHSRYESLVISQEGVGIMTQVTDKHSRIIQVSVVRNPEPDTSSRSPVGAICPEATCLSVLSPGTTGTYYMLGSLYGAGGLNSGPHTCVESTD